MDLQGSSVCLTALKYIGDIKTDYDNILTIIEKSDGKPSDLIDDLDDIEKEIRRIDATVSILPNVLKAVRNMFNNELSNLRDTRRILLEKITVGESKNRQMNTSAILYNEDQMLKDIYISYENEKEPCIWNICTDEIINASEYSVYNIIKRFHSEGNLMDSLSIIFDQEWNQCFEATNALKSSTLSFSQMITDGEFIKTLSQDDDEAIQAKRAAYYTIGNSCAYELIRKQRSIVQMFRIMIDLTNNCDIYVKAVDSYTSITLESLLDGYAGYEFGV